MHTAYQHVVQMTSPNKQHAGFTKHNSLLFNCEMETFSDRIAEAAVAAGGQNALARKLTELTGKNVTQSNIGYLINGRPDRGPPRSSELTPYIAQIVGFNTDWLATGRGEKFAQPSAAAYPEIAHETKTEHHRVTNVAEQHYHARSIDIPSESAYIPIFNATASMGSGRDLPEIEYQIGAMQISHDWLRQNLNISHTSNLAVISADGDSMAPTFSSGDLLLIDRQVDRIKTDAVYALVIDGQLYVKRLSRDIADGSVAIISDNPAYGTQRITRERAEQLQVVGRVVFAWRGAKL